MVGSEYFINAVSSAETGDPVFHGGEALVSYLFTGEEHPYNERGGFFEFFFAASREDDPESGGVQCDADGAADAGAGAGDECDFRRHAE